MNSGITLCPASPAASPRRGGRSALSVLLATATLSALTAFAAPAQAGCALSTMDIPVRIVNYRPIATLVLNGTEVSMLVDSGAFFSMLPESTARQLNLRLQNLPFGFRVEGYTGSVDAQMTRVEKVGLRGAEMKRVEFIVGGNELGSGIQGILGRNILSVADTEYDLAHGVIRLTVPNGECDKASMAYWAGEAPVIEAPFDRATHSRDTAIRVEVSINGRKTTAVMDTGAPQTALTLDAAKASGMDPAAFKPYGRVGGAGVGRVRSWVGMVDTFELGGEKISNNLMQVNDTDNFDHGMLIGLDYFLAHRIYVSRLQKKIYATWNGGVIFEQQRNKSSGNYDQRYAALPEDIAPDDADALARRGNASVAKGDPKKALEDLNRAIELAPNVAAYRLDRARAQLALRQPRAALADLDEILRMAPAQADARLLRAGLRMRAKNNAGAQADLRELDASLAPSAQQRAEMANLYVRLGQLPEAMRQWDLWMPTHESDMAYASALNQRCWIRARYSVDLDKAVEDCKEAISRDKTSPAFRDSLGWAYLRQGDAARAKKAFDAALALQAAHAWSLYGRGMAQLKLKNAEASHQDLKAARQMSPHVDEAVRLAGFEVAPDAPPPAATAAALAASSAASEAASEAVSGGAEEPEELLGRERGGSD